MIITLNTKSNLILFLEKKASGTERQYLVSEVFRNKLDKIVFVADQLNKKFNAIPLIEVKYKFGFLTNGNMDFLHYNVFNINK